LCFTGSRNDWVLKGYTFGVLKTIKNFIMNVKHTPTGIVHKGQKGGTTGCGTNTNTISTHWTNTNDKITCDKNGCKN
jgi:hypothetical protein